VQDGAEAFDLKNLRAREQAGLEFEFARANAFVHPNGFGETAAEQRVDASVIGLKGPEMIVVRRQSRAVLLVELLCKANDVTAENNQADRFGAIRGTRTRRGA